MLIGYASVSTADQTIALQQDALITAGCTKIFTDTASGAKAERHGLEEAIDYAREGDTLVVWRLDRLGRSLRHLIETITALNTRKIGFKSIIENIDTTTSGGKLIPHLRGVFCKSPKPCCFCQHITLVPSVLFSGSVLLACHRCGRARGQQVSRLAFSLV